jgi:DNA-binding GntR family transcriptional regulator
MQDRIRTSLEQEIVSGLRPPGSPIDEKQLASQFKASRTPVREALLTLAVQGLVRIVPRSGIFVRQASAGELVALLEALEEVEAVLARLAARRMTPDQRDRLELAEQQTAHAAAQNDRPAYEKANNQLHALIYQASNNPVLVEQVRNLRNRLSAYRLRAFDAPGRLQASSREHAAIVKAICAGDGEQAAAAMRAHINVGGEAMVTLILRAAQDDAALEAAGKRATASGTRPGDVPAKAAPGTRRGSRAGQA